MEQANPNADVLGRILSAPSKVVLLRSPAARGKTTAALAFYHHYIEGNQNRCLMLLPNAPSVAAMRNQLLASSPGGIAVSPTATINTFAALAERILAQTVPSILPDAKRILLLRTIVDCLAAEGKLSTLRELTDTPGLIQAIDRAISQLKRAAVEPLALEKAIGKGTKGKNRDLLEIYKRYQDHLLKNNTYDLEGRMWQARDIIKAGDKSAHLPNVSAIAVDGFTDFTPTQLEILALLAGQTERMLITLPYDDSQAERARMFHWTQRTLDNIRKVFGSDLTEIALASGLDQGGANTLKPMWDNVFNHDAPKIAPPENLRIIASVGIESQVTATAVRVKRLLAESTEPASVAVLTPVGNDEYAREVRKIFTEYDIPIAGQPRPLTDEPIVRFVLDVLSLPGEFAFNHVLRVISSSYFRPQALGEFDAETVATAGIIIREGNVFQGRQSYANAAKRLAYKNQQSDESDTLSRAAAMLEKLFDLAERFATRELKVEGLIEIIDNLQLPEAALSHDDAELIARDLRVLSAWRQTIEQIDAPLPSLRYLREVLSAAAAPLAHHQAVVTVLDVLDARCVRYGHVFLLGLEEGTFPRRITDSSLLGEADRASWANRGLLLPSRPDLNAQQMLLFYLAISRANRSLTLGYQHIGSAGQEKAPGSFLTALADTFGGIARAEELPMFTKLAPGQFIPHQDDIACPAEAVNAAVAGLFDTDQPAYPSALYWVHQNAPKALAGAAMGIHAHRRRWQVAPCDNFDGMITASPLLEYLGEKFSSRNVFSAAQLGMFGQCPWSFFATYVLGLSALDTPQRRIEPVTRGIFCHNVLFRLMSALRGDGSEVNLSQIPEDQLMAALGDAVEAESNRVESQNPPYPALWRLQCEQLHEHLRQYVKKMQADDQLHRREVYFEFGFGMKAGRADSLDPASSTKPVTIKTSEGKILIRGKIDRVDRIEFDSRAGLFVIDYKTGHAPNDKDITAGRNLQLPIYAHAVSTLLGEDCLGGAFHRIGPNAQYEKLFATMSKRKSKYSPDKKYSEKLLAALEKIGQFVAAMRAGRFELLPTGRCPDYCPFNRICQFTPARADLKGEKYD